MEEKQTETKFIYKHWSVVGRAEIINRKTIINYLKKIGFKSSKNLPGLPNKI